MEGLRGHEEDLAGFVGFLSLLFRHIPVELGDLVEGDLCDCGTKRLALLSDEGLGWGYEENQAVFKPPVKVEHDG